MNLLKNKKGFTLIELLVSISIMGIILIITLPQISNIQEKNKDTKYIKYEESLVASAKLYTDSYTEDMFGNNPTGCIDIPYEELKSKQLVKDIKIDNATCGNKIGEPPVTYVRIRKAYDQYIYTTAIICKDKTTNEENYKTTLSGPCSIDETPDFEGPEISISPSYSDWTTGIEKGEKVHAIVSIWDKFGILENAKIKISWTKDGKKYEDPYIYDFRNKRNEGSDPLHAITHKIEVPYPQTGEFVLKVEPVDVRDSLGNAQEKAPAPVTFLLDNTAPKQNTIEVMSYKWVDNNTTPTTSSGLSSYTSNQWTNKFIYTEPSTAIDDHSGKTYPERIYYKYETSGAIGVDKGEGETLYKNINTKGTSYIKYIACDPLGNCTKETPNTIIKIDTDPPKCIVTASGSGGSNGKTWVNQDSTPPSRTITAKCEDITGTGSKSDCTTSTKTFSHTYDYNINTTTAGAKGDNNGGYVEDVAGNRTDCAAQETVKVDLTDPTCGTMYIDGTEGIYGNDWYTTNVNITNSDGYDTKKSVESGHNETYLIYDGNKKETLTINFESDEETVKLVTTDIAGNKCENKRIIRVDKSKPGNVSSTVKKAGTIITPLASDDWVNQNLWWGNFNATDGISGIHHYEYSTDCTGTKSGNLNETNGHTYSNTGARTYCARAVNNAGIVGNWTNPYYFNIDKEKPSAPTVALVDPGWKELSNDTWYNLWAIYVSGGTSSSNAKPTSTDTGGSGIKKYQISKNNSTWYDWNYDYNSSTYKITTEGTTYRYVRAVDNAGNTSDVTTKIIKKDQTPPSAPTVALVDGSWNSLSNNTWYNKNVYVSGGTSSSNAKPYSEDTNGSGIKKYQISTDNSNWYDWNYNYNSSTYKITTEGTTYRYVRAIDNVDNISAVTTKTIKIDKTAPTIPTVTIYKWSDNNTQPSSSSGLSKYTVGTWSNKKTYSVASGSTDTGGSGDVYYQCTTRGETENVTNLNTSTKNINANGTSSISFRACDKVGNCSNHTSSQTITIDREKPKINSISNPTGGSETTDPITVTLYGTDTHNSTDRSGLKKWQWKYDHTDWADLSNSDYSGYQTTFSAIRNEYAYFRLCDVAGNCSDESSTKINIAEKEPEFSCSIGDEETFGTAKGSHTGNYINSWTDLSDNPWFDTNWCHADGTSCDADGGYMRVCIHSSCAGLTAQYLNDTYDCGFSRYWCSCK